MNIKPFLIFLSILFGINCLSAQTLPIVEVADNRHFFKTSDGKPFFWLGDTGWLLFSKLTHEEAELYFKNRQEKGFNVIQASLLHTLDAKNAYGDSALIRQDMANLNLKNLNDDKTYWGNISYIIDLAAKHDIYIALIPAWGGVLKNKNTTVEKAGKYADWLANTFKDKTNIIWFTGGDVRGNDVEDIIKTMGRKIREIDKKHLISFHPFGRTQSSTWFHNEPWLDFNMFQSGHRNYEQDSTGNKFGEDNWKYVIIDYNKTPIKPVIDGEPSYEGIPQGLHHSYTPKWKAEDVRRYAYWSVFAGACGFTYGHSSVMQFYNPSNDDEPAYHATMDWKTALNAEGASQMQYFKNLILSYPYYERIPDQSLIHDPQKEKYQRVAATRGKDYALIYTYTGEKFSVNMKKITGKTVNAFWFNPRTGEKTFIREYKNKGVTEFTPPDVPQNGNDRVLIIESVYNNTSKSPLIRCF
ncbi:MAG: glycoside hydrolase family 140 protein [Dysgonomonas sp.]